MDTGANLGGATVKKKSANRRPVKVVFRPASRQLKIALVVLIVLFTVALFALHFAIQGSRARYEAARSQAAGLEHDNQKLEEINDAKGTTWWIEQIAKDLWDWVRPGSQDMNVDYT